MHRDNELSATEKLLDLIRAGDDGGVAADRFPPAPDRIAKNGRSLSGKERKPENGPPLRQSRPLFSRPCLPAGFFRRRNNEIIVGVCLGETSLKVAVAPGSGGPDGLREYAVYPVEQPQSAAPLDDADAWLDSPAMKATLRRALEAVRMGAAGGSLRRLQVWTAVAGHHVDVHLLTIPKVAADEAANSVFWAARKNIEGYNPQTHILDFTLHPSPENDDKSRAFVFLTPRNLVERLQKLFTAVSFPLAGITTPAAAIRNLQLRGRLPARQAPFSYLQIEENHSFISLFQGGKIEFSRDIKTGLQSILEFPEHQAPDPFPTRQGDIAFSPEAAGEEPPAAPISDGPAGEETAPEEEQESDQQFDQRAVTRLVRQMERTFDYCRTTLAVPRPEHVYVSCPIPLGRSLVKNLEEELGIGCSWLDPFAAVPEGVDAVPAPVGEHQRQLLAVAVGLAFCDRRSSQNFLLTYPDKEKQRFVQKVNTLILTVFIVFALGLAGLYLHRQGVVRDLRQQLSMVQKERLELAAGQDNEVHLAGLAAEIGDRRQEIIRRTGRLQPLIVFAEIQNLLPAEVALLDIEASAAGFVDIRGVITGRAAESNLVLARFLRRLAGSGLVREARVVEQEEVPAAGEEPVLLFRLQGEVQAPESGEGVMESGEKNAGGKAG
jgi:Tfp pilus assembly PilM family ATPase